MELPIIGIEYTPQSSLCLPQYSIFRLRARLVKSDSALLSSTGVRVCIRTNLGEAITIRKQIIEGIDKGFSRNWDYHDIE